MTVTVTIDFTDGQWDLIQEHHHCPVPKYDEEGEWIGTDQETPTPEILATDLKRRLADVVTGCIRSTAIENAVKATENVF
jgi:hypothetical protein